MSLIRIANRNSAVVLLSLAMFGLAPGAVNAQLSPYGWDSDNPAFDYGGTLAGVDYGVTSGGFGYGTEGFGTPLVGFDYGLSNMEYGMSAFDDRSADLACPTEGYGQAYGSASPNDFVVPADPLVGAAPASSSVRSDGAKSAKRTKRETSRRARPRDSRKPPVK